MKSKLPVKIKIIEFFGLGPWYEDYLMRKALRSRGFLIYTRKAKAIRRARHFTEGFKIVYWVIKEDIGYYVVNLEHIRKLNTNEMKRKGGKKIRTRDLDKLCVWRSPFYSNLILTK